SADEPLTTYIHLAPESPYRLVVDGAEINGIITRSDLQKLPVRLYVFTHVTHLETVMRDLIVMHIKEESLWLKELKDERQRALRRSRYWQKKQGFDPPLIDLTLFSDKVTIIGKTFPVESAYHE